MSVRSTVRKHTVKQEPIPVISLPNSSNSDTEFVYYEAQYINDTASTVPAAFKDSRTDPIVSNMSEYKMAVTRLSIGAAALPLFVVRGNKPNCSVAMYYAPDNIGATGTVFDAVATARVFEISNFFNATDRGGGLNATLAKVFLNLQNQYDVIHGPGAWAANALLPQNPPGFQYDPDTNLITMYTPPENLDTDPNRVNLFMSGDITPFFFGFAFYPAGPSPFVSPAWYRFSVNQSFNQPTVTIGGDSYLPITQDYSSVSKWYTFNRLVLVSESLGSRNTYISFIKAGDTSSSSNRQFATIVDFSTNLDNSLQNNPATNITYIPQNLRWIDCLQDGALKTVNLSLQFLDEAGDFLPATIVSGSSFNVTLCFAKAVF